MSPRNSRGKAKGEKRKKEDKGIMVMASVIIVY